MRRLRNTITTKLANKLLIIITMGMGILTFLLIGLAVVFNWFLITRYYNDKTMEIADTAAHLVDSDYISELYDAISTAEFGSIIKEAQKNGDYAAVKQWMQDNNMSERFEEEIDRLNSLTETMSAEYIYIQIVDGNKCYTIIDPNEDYNSLGYCYELTGTEYDYITGNQIVEPNVSESEYGWLSSGGMPVYNSEGTAVAIAFCDLAMNDIVNGIVKPSCINLMLGIVIAIIVLLIMRKKFSIVITSPIEQLTDAVDNFGTDESSFSSDNIVMLGIDTGDEIEELYHAIHFMQESIINYMANLTAVTAEKERIGAELDIATRIQASMLPSIYPAFPDRKEFDIYATMDPAKEVGGDFYDYYMIDDDHLGIVMADVSGKGVPAALFMMMSKIIISNYAHMHLSPSEVLRRTNDSICENNAEDMFVTVWFGILEISTGHIVAGNAGHEYPMIRKKNGLFEILEDKHDFVIGAMEGMPYSEYEFDLEKGGTLFLYTDGCPEATNNDDELFDTDRMLEALNKNPDADTRELLHNMTDAVDRFVKDAAQFDDLTMLAIKLF